MRGLSRQAAMGISCSWVARPNLFTLLFVLLTARICIRFHEGRCSRRATLWLLVGAVLAGCVQELTGRTGEAWRRVKFDELLAQQLSMRMAYRARRAREAEDDFGLEPRLPDDARGGGDDA